nr:hypothetical protein OG409_02510 [Streptomyces sp. NBC_00974]
MKASPAGEEPSRRCGAASYVPPREPACKINKVSGDAYDYAIAGQVVGLSLVDAMAR